MTNHSFFHYLLILLPVLALSCARPQSPTGGPKDEDPPELVEANPQKETLLFKGDEISMEFNEYIKLKNIKNELTVTPKINEDYEFQYNKKTVKLTNLQLEDSTTYTFNFGGAVTDITENNPAENLLIIFSTGDFLDSLSINGSVTDILTGERVENALLAIYDINDTLDVFTGRAQYSIKANKEGQFNFTNIKNGQYRIYAVDDQNKNFECEPDKESFGFLGEIIDLQQNYDSLKLYTRKRNFRSFKLTNLRTTGKYFEARFNKYVMSYQLEAVNDSLRRLFSTLTDKNEVLRIYNNIKTLDSLQVHLTAFDTINQSIDTLFYLKFQESKRKSPDFNVNLRDSEINTSAVFNGKITFNKPVLYLNTDSLLFQYDSTTVQNIDSLTDLKWNDNRTELTIQKQLNPDLINKDTTTAPKPTNQRRIPGKESFDAKNPNNKVTLLIPDNTFISIEMDSSAQITEEYNFTSSANLGIIMGEVFTDFPAFIIQLTNTNFEVQAEIINKKKYKFNDLKPGDYKIRVLIDTNQNGQWDPGDVSDFIEPEPVYHLNKTLTVRPNWELNENINIE
ncbi:Ig-like domain-containing protein [Fulvivirgaceae bacterium BMA12]|uniref:Ig-like domain-containing protein n=1 Tax=Agaribacillus aureus TaxID=3051825 RepID=A0ABT8LC32_9BACT|nr:Ig-like domain-containing protein [Fulvivirgaceae bacterium BMA12]